MLINWEISILKERSFLNTNFACFVKISEDFVHKKKIITQFSGVINYKFVVVVCTLLLPIYAFNYGILVIANCNWRLLAIGLNTRRNVAHVQRLASRHGELLLLHEPHTTTARFQLTERRRFNTGKRLRKRAASKQTWEKEKHTSRAFFASVWGVLGRFALSVAALRAVRLCVCVCNTCVSSRYLCRHLHGK